MRIAFGKFLRLAMLLVITTFCSNSYAFKQDASATLQAANQLTKWFEELLGSFQEIGETADRQKLINALVDLNRSLFDVEQDKRYVVVALQRRPLVLAELQQSSNTLLTKITGLQASLRKFGPKLRIAYRAGGDKAINSLSNAISSKRAFANTLGEVTEETAERYSDEAKAAIQALSQAQEKLADVIVALQKQN